MKLKESVVISKVKDGYILVDSNASDDRFNGLIKLNETTKDIIEHFRQETTIEQVINSMLEEYDTTYEILYKDVINVEEKLKNVGLMEGE